MKFNLQPLKDPLIKILIGIILVLFICLLSGLNTVANMPKTVKVEKYQLQKNEIKLLKSKQEEPLINALLDENGNCIGGIGCSKQEWYPGELNKEGNAQEMPPLTSEESHQRFIELANKYGLPADIIWETENYYGLKEGTILCIAIAETSGGKEGTYGRKGCYNYGNVGNTDDPNNRRCFANQGAGLAAIGQTLNNSLLKNNQTIACLNGAGECIEPNANGKRYSTGKSGNRQRNMIGCFYSIYQQKINPQTFNLHQR